MVIIAQSTTLPTLSLSTIFPFTTFTSSRKCKSRQGWRDDARKKRGRFPPDLLSPFLLNIVESLSDTSETSLPHPRYLSIPGAGPDSDGVSLILQTRYLSCFPFLPDRVPVRVPRTRPSEWFPFSCATLLSLPITISVTNLVNPLAKSNETVRVLDIPVPLSQDMKSGDTYRAHKNWRWVLPWKKECDCFSCIPGWFWHQAKVWCQRNFWLAATRLTVAVKIR